MHPALGPQQRQPDRPENLLEMHIPARHPQPPLNQNLWWGPDTRVLQALLGFWRPPLCGSPGIRRLSSLLAVGHLGGMTGSVCVTL